MNIDTRIYGYLGDGFIVCCACAELYETDDDPDLLRPLGAYSGILDRACGETCEDCHGEITPGHDEDDEACEDCGWEPEPEPSVRVTVTVAYRPVWRYEDRDLGSTYLRECISEAEAWAIVDNAPDCFSPDFPGAFVVLRTETTVTEEDLVR